MLVLLGIVIFIISFAVALISLIREEKQQQELIQRKHIEEESLVQAAAKSVLEKESEVAKSDVGFVQLAAKVDAEQKKQNLKETSDTSDSEPSEDLQRAAFPWEAQKQEDVESLQSVPGDEVIEEVQSVQESGFEDVKISPSDARFPSLGPVHKPLSGSFRISDLKKDK